MKSYSIFRKLSFMLIVGLATSCTSQKKELTTEQQAIINKAKANFVFVEGGTFIMGKKNVPTAYEHEVTLSSYSISKYETSFKELDLYSEINKLEKVAFDYRDLKEFGPNYPAKWMTWYQADAYCKWLGQQIGTPLGLPTEAQWEYAARSRGLDVQHATNN